MRSPPRYRSSAHRTNVQYRGSEHPLKDAICVPLLCVLMMLCADVQYRAGLFRNLDDENLRWVIVARETFAKSFARAASTEACQDRNPCHFEHDQFEKVFHNRLSFEDHGLKCVWSCALMTRQSESQVNQLKDNKNNYLNILHTVYGRMLGSIASCNLHGFLAVIL